MEEHTYKAAWSAVDRTADPHRWVQLSDLAHEGREEDPASNSGLFQMLHVEQGQRMLDVGCGAGGAARALARLLGSGSQVVGVDNSETMISQARKRSADLGLPVAFEVADIHALPFAEGSFDACYALNVFEIVEDPHQALAEMVRVIRPGGRVAISAPDDGTLALDAADRPVTRKILNYICDCEVNGWLGRQLPGLFGEFGLRDIVVAPVVSTGTDYLRFHELGLPTYVAHALAAGVITEDEAANWLADIERRSRERRFFTIQLYFLVAGTRP